MIDLIYLLLLLAVLWDSHLLRSLDRERFLTAFQATRLYSILIFIVFLLYAILGIKESHFTAAFLGCVFLPLYFLKRRQYFVSLPTVQPETGNTRREPLIMADCLGVILGWFLANLLISVFLKELQNTGWIKIGSLGEVLLTTLISSVVLLFLIARISNRLDARGFQSAVKLTAPSKGTPLIIILAGGLGILFGYFSAQMLVSRAIQPQTPLNELVAANDSSGAIMGFLLMALLVAPFVEEITFRGYFYNVLSRYFNPRVGLYVIAGLFGFMHMGQYWGDWVAIVMVMILGFVLTGLRALTHSTIPSIVMHYVYNFSVMVIALIMLVQTYPDYFKYKAYAATLSYEEKEGLLKDSIRKRPQFAEAYHDLAWLYVEEKGGWEDAVELVNKALKLEPDNKMYAESKKEILEKLQEQ